MAEKTKKREKRIIYRSEIVLYCILGVIWLFGFILGILGICAYDIGKLATNPIYQAEVSLGDYLGWDGLCDFRIVGTVIMLIAMVLLVIVIYIYSNKAKEQAASDRRAEERRRILMEDMDLTDSVSKVSSQPEEKVEENKE